MNRFEELIEEISFIIRGKNRKKIMYLLVDNTKTPKEIVEETGIKYANVSSTLKQLKEEKLVECINPTVRKGKKYKLTKLGKETIDIIIENYSGIEGLELK